jgi:hypothetical protein
MSPQTRVALRPKNEATRQPGQAKRVTTNVINYGNDQLNLTARRAQHLVRALGLSNHRARLIADLAWQTLGG